MGWRSANPSPGELEGARRGGFQAQRKQVQRRSEEGVFIVCKKTSTEMLRTHTPWGKDYIFNQWC
jgi:hypothetical protein